MKGLEPPPLSGPDPKSGAAAITPHPQTKKTENFILLFRAGKCKNIVKGEKSC